MKIRANFDRFASMLAADYEWIASPAAGVDRVMLDRVGGERARATSIVRYAPHSEFPEHEHSGGEEYFVLDGEFGDEHGLYPKGFYVRNPIGTAHSPKVGPTGAVIWVKLRQFTSEDQAQIAIDTSELIANAGSSDSVSFELHRFGAERVSIEMLVAGDTLHLPASLQGAEILVIDGDLHIADKTYGCGSWVRSLGDELKLATRGTSAALILKTGHLGTNFTHIE